MVRSILVPTDGSDNSYRALEEAVRIANSFDAKVHALSVVKTIPKQDRLRYDPQDDADEAIETAEEVVSKEGIEFVGDTREGLPDEQIRLYAAEHDVDMIVVGTHGRSGLDRVLIGSVAERTIRTSPVPVLTVPSSRSQSG